METADVPAIAVPGPDKIAAAQASSPSIELAEYWIRLIAVGSVDTD